MLTEKEQATNEVNANRFNMSPQLVKIFENTVDLLV